MNFRKSPTNTFRDVYFRDKAKMSDHTSCNLRMFAWCFCDKIGQLSVELLDPRLKDNVLGFFNSLPEQKFWNVCVNKKEGAFTWCLNSLVKISRYMVVCTMPAFSLFHLTIKTFVFDTTQVYCDTAASSLAVSCSLQISVLFPFWWNSWAPIMNTGKASITLLPHPKKRWRQ